MKYKKNIKVALAISIIIQLHLVWSLYISFFRPKKKRGKDKEVNMSCCFLQEVKCFHELGVNLVETL